MNNETGIDDKEKERKGEATVFKIEWKKYEFCVGIGLIFDLSVK